MVYEHESRENPVIDGGVNQSKSRGRLMVDAPVRMFHALFALCFFGAWLTAESESWRSLHVTLGYSMIGLLLFRIAYGLFGPQQARLSSLFGRLKRLWAGFARKGEAHPDGNMNWNSFFGTLQNSSMALLVLLLIVLAVITCLSGYLAWNDAPEWIAEIHEETGDAMIALGVIHIVLVLFFSIVRKRNMALTMLTGRIKGQGASIVQHNRAWLACAMLIAVCAFAAYDLQQTSAKASADRDITALVSAKKDGKHKDAERKEKHKGKHERKHEW
jgi:cytochrome b